MVKTIPYSVAQITAHFPDAERDLPQQLKKNHKIRAVKKQPCVKLWYVCTNLRFRRPSPDGEGGFCAANSRAKDGRGEKASQIALLRVFCCE